MTKLESATKILSILSEYEKRCSSENFDLRDAGNIHDLSILTRDLGQDGLTAVLSVPKAVSRASAKRDDAEVERIRLTLIEHFRSKQEAQNSTLGRRSAADREFTFRARMKAEGAASEIQSPHEPSKFELAKSGVALFIYCLVGFTAWAWLAPMLYEFLDQRYVINALAVKFALVVSTIVAYGYAMVVLWRRVKTALESLVDPTPTPEKSSPSIVARYIASALVAGLTIMLVVLLVNYIVHSAAAAAEDARVAKIAQIVSQHHHLWGVFAAVPQGAEITSGLAADFGSFAGTFGDFFGGLINPILTFGTLVALAVTLLMQRTQLNDEKHRAGEAASVSNLQTFETTFFNLLSLHANTVSGLHFVSDDIRLASETVVARPRSYRADAGEHDESTTSGRAVFTDVVETMHEVPGRRDIGKFVNRKYATPGGVYKIIQERHNYALGHYFRNLYQVLAFVDRYSVRLRNDSIHEDYKARKRYTNILRAQLSAHELCLLFYNCDGELVDNGAFRDLLIEWEVLEHIPLRYSYKKHHLYIEGFEEYPVDHMIDQYLGDLLVDQRRGGAFGKNPQVAVFLELQPFLI
jgi:hypothetical protein